MYIWESDMSEFVMLTLAVGCMFLFSATMLYLVLFKPEYRDRILEFSKPTESYLGENGDGAMMLIILLFFIMFCCMFSLILYGWIQVAIQ